MKPEEILKLIDKSIREEIPNESDDPYDYHPRAWWEQYLGLREAQAGRKLRTGVQAGIMQTSTQTRQGPTGRIYQAPVYRLVRISGPGKRKK